MITPSFLCHQLGDVDGNSIEIDLNSAALVGYEESDLYIKYDGMPGDLYAMDGSEFTYFEPPLYVDDSTGGDPSGDGVSGLSFENAYYDSSMNMLRVQFMGDIDSGMLDKSRIRDNVRVYKYDYSTSILYAINS